MFTLYTETLPHRDEAMLSREVPAPEANHPPAPAPYDIVAPGLYPDESAYALDNGALVAVSIRRERSVNNGGLEFTVWGRWIGPDGATKLDDAGQEVEISFTFRAATPLIAEFGVPTISRELLLAVLGEPAEAMHKITVEPWPENLPDDFKAEIAAGKHKLLGEPGTVIERPIVFPDPNARLECSIRTAIDYCGYELEPHPASLLG